MFLTCRYLCIFIFLSLLDVSGHKNSRLSVQEVLLNVSSVDVQTTKTQLSIQYPRSVLNSLLGESSYYNAIQTEKV